MLKPYLCGLLSAGLLCIGLTGCNKNTTAEESATPSKNTTAEKPATPPQNTTDQKPKTPPKELPSTLKIKSNSDAYVITGIGLSGNNSFAIINDKIYKKGDEIAPDVILEDIQLTYANILANGENHLIRPESIQHQMNK